MEQSELNEVRAFAKLIVFPSTMERGIMEESSMEESMSMDRKGCRTRYI